jgi:hypothetical protein
VFAAQQLRGAAGTWWANLVAAQPAGHRITWQEFHDAFRAHYIPDGVMAMKLEEFLSLKQGNQTVFQYIGKFNHLSQYAAEYMNTDAKKKSCFMRGLNTKIQAALVTCYNVTYHEVVNVAIASEEKSRIHKESKKKKQVLSSSSGSIKKHQKFIYHPQNHFCPPYLPPQYQARTQTFICHAATQQYPQQPNAPRIRNQSPIPHNLPCYNYGKPGHFSRDCPYPRQYNHNYPRAPVPQQQ